MLRVLNLLVLNLLIAFGKRKNYLELQGPSKGFSRGSQQKLQMIEIWSKLYYNPYLKRNWCALVKYFKNSIYALKINKLKFFITRGQFLRSQLLAHHVLVVCCWHVVLIAFMRFYQLLSLKTTCQQQTTNMWWISKVKKITSLS